MRTLSPRNLDRAVERRWPRLFRFDVRQALWAAIAMQAVVGLRLLVYGDESASSAMPLLAGSIALIARVLVETRTSAAARL